MKNLWQALMLVRRCDKRSFGRRVCYTLMQSLLPLANLYFLKRLVDAVGGAFAGTGGADGFLPWLLAMTAAVLLNRVVAALDRVNGDVLGQRLTDYVSDLVQRQASRLDMAYYDMPEYHDTLHRAQQEAGQRPLAVLDHAMGVAGAAVSAVGVAAMLAGASWWVVAVMAVAVVPSFVVRLRKAQAIYRFRRDNTQLYRRTAYYHSLLTARPTAAEMRVFGLAPHFRALFVEARARLVGRLLRISRRLGAADVACALVEAAALLAVALLLAWRTLGGALTMGSFVMMFEAFRRGQGYLAALASGVAGLYDSRLFVGNLFELLRMEPAVTAPADALPVPEKIERVELRDVTFRYPGMDRDVLSHYSMTARVGEVTRLEGENGRGKSTVVKLLLRLYDPQQGAVLVDGVDVRRFDPAALRARMGVLMQDFVRYQCTLNENIAPHGGEPTAEALALSGVDRVARSLPQGGDTPLGRLFDGGSELSMGQWQRVALARALQSDAPVLLLDEPTAWLDAEGRQRFDQAVDQLKENKIVILITHA